MDRAATARRLQDLLGLRSPPIALTFLSAPPPGISRIDRSAPAGCTYWKYAAEGRTFYTEAADHFNCPIGAYTHGIDLPPERAPELMNVLGTMFGLGYVREDEVPGIPRKPGAFGVAVYAPLASSPCEPDVVLLLGNAKQVMLLSEAAQAAGVGARTGLMGRPTCAAIPLAVQTQTAVASLGCIGNRVYTGLADDELYVALPGKHAAAVADKLAVILNANSQLDAYHQARAKSLCA